VTYVLDSTAIIDYVTGYPPGEALLDRLAADTADLYVCDVVVCEVLSKGGPRERAVVQGILDGLEYVAIPPESARWAADQRRATIEAGHRKPSTTDALVAAAAKSLGATVVTRNAKDFEAFDVPILGYGETVA
jgi:predicted nucleic acid-binding protein